MVKISGWLIGENQFGAVSKRAGDGYPLLLPNRKLRRSVAHAIGEANSRQQMLGPVRINSFAKEHPKFDIFFRGETRKEIECLKDKSQLLGSQSISFRFTQAVETGLVDHDLSGIDRNDSGNRMKQRGLS